MRAYLFVTAFVFASANAFAEPAVRVEARLHVNGQAMPTAGANAYVSKPLTGPWGFSAWLQVEKAWGEAYLGLTYSPRPWVELGVSAGIEQAAEPWRVAASLWLGYGRFSSLTIIENGGSGWWYQSVALIKATNWLKVGAMIKRFEGAGLRLDFALTPATNLWAAYLPFDAEARSINTGRMLIGVNRSF